MRVARNGLTELYRPSDDKAVEAHVIFVHGLLGSPDKTWTKDVSGRRPVEGDGRDPSPHAIFWPRELLPKIVPRAAVHTWGYDADIDNFMQPASKNSVYQHAGNLLTDLCDLRDAYEDKTIPFIFIAHSLGGLVVKDALNRSSNELGTRIKDIAPNTLAICFLGTPHRGSKLAKSGRRTAALMSLGSRQPNVKLIQALEQNSEILDRIGDSFLQTLDKHGFQIASFCEEKEIRLLVIFNLFIVEPDSAKIGHSKEETGTIPADHRNMAKFDSESDTGFSRVSKTIKRWIETAVLSRKDEYQDCLHSLQILEADVRYHQVAKNHDKTFVWLFEKNTIQFTDWLSEAKGTGPTGNLFWITGKPGSGKSTIMKYAIRNSRTMHHLEASNTRDWHIIPFFFSDRGSERQRAFQTMLQEILYQLLFRIGDSFTLVNPLYTRLARTQETTTPKWDLDALREGISEVIVKSTSETGICLFMDALDEHSGDNEDLCKFFWELSSKSAGSIVLKICLASRPWPVFQKHFQDCRGFAIHEHTENDIRNYVTSRLYEASNRTEPRDMATEGQMQGEIGINELAQDVTGKAQGVFIWVRLVIDELCQGLTDGTPITMLREVLKNIPHELEDLYARALGKVRREYAAEAHILLHMVLGSLSTLHIQTLLDCASWLLVGMTDAQNLKSQASRLASRTGGLLEVVNSNGSSIVQFIHQTAKEYIRSYGDRLRLKYPDSVFDSSSPLYSFTNDGFELQCIEGPQLLLLCGVQGQSFSESIIPHIFAYAKEVDNKLPSLVGMKRAALDSLNQLLNNENLWQRCSAYASLKSFTAGPSLVELAIAANWRNMIRECFTSDGDITGAAHLAALGPSILDDCTDRIGMVKALIDGYRQPSRSSYDPFQLSMHATQPRGLRRARQLEFPLISSSYPPAEQVRSIVGVSERRTRMIGVSERRRMLKSVDAVADDIKDETALLTTLISIKNHPFVSESEIIEIATSLLENDAEPLIGEDTTITLRIGDGRIVYFRSALSFCLHLRSVEWVNIFLKKTRQSIRPSQSLAHCLASGRDSANPTLRADFLWKAFGKVEEELRPILDDEGEIFGVGWPLAWLGSQCGIVGFPHINRSFCSSEDH